MKIVLVSIPNHHFFQWTNQLKDAGHEIFWFDISGVGNYVEKISWVNQIVGWKIRYNYPFRSKIKRKLPWFFTFLKQFNERKTQTVFAENLLNIKPDVVHCFDMELTGFQILKTLQKSNIPLFYSSWGSDIFYFRERGFTENQVSEFLKRVDFLITDCTRDFLIAKKNGFSGEFLGVFPGNGGISIQEMHKKEITSRKIILIKGYQFDVGEAIKIIKALEKLSVVLLSEYEIVIYSAEKSIENYLLDSSFFKSLKIKIYSRNNFINNDKLISIMGKSCLHIGNNLSDGIPNSLIEAMGMGAFPIQSNPGNATAELITHGKNGYLIENPLDIENISDLIKAALQNIKLRSEAQLYNESFINKNYERSLLRPKILELYEQI